MCIHASVYECMYVCMYICTHMSLEYWNSLLQKHHQDTLVVTMTYIHICANIGATVPLYPILRLCCCCARGRGRSIPFRWRAENHFGNIWINISMCSLSSTRARACYCTGRATRQWSAVCRHARAWLVLRTLRLPSVGPQDAAGVGGSGAGPTWDRHASEQGLEVRCALCDVTCQHTAHDHPRAPVLSIRDTRGLRLAVLSAQSWYYIARCPLVIFTQSHLFNNQIIQML